MSTLLTLTMIALCVGCIIQSLWRPTALSVFLGTLALFSIGYYGLPMLLIERSSLRYLPESEVAATIAMCLSFLVFLVAGFAFSAKRSFAPPLSLPVLDDILSRHWWPGFIFSSSIIISYYATNTLTIYQVEYVPYYIEDRSVIAGALGFFAVFFQALAAVYFVKAIEEKSITKIVCGVAAILIQLLLVYQGANRLLFLTPILISLGAIVAAGHFRLAGTALATAIIALLAFSPFAVALRAGSWNSTQSIVAENFSYGSDPFDTVLQSIVDRGDILEVTSSLKKYTDDHGYVKPIYYLSVLAIPVPRVLFKSKPSVLSTTGELEGEASIIAWQIRMGPTIGSLTAFGSIVAYREGGWVWMMMNGFITGALLATLLSSFARGKMLGHTFYAIAFLNWSVAKVPPSLFEALALMMTFVPIILILLVANRMLHGFSTSGGSKPYSRLVSH